MDNSSDATFFFGAGASAPFGIPTMKQLVADFEDFLKKRGDEEEGSIFSDIKSTLEKTLQRQVDLEDVFTVIDGIRNYGVERIGLVSVYSSVKEFSKIPSPKVNTTACLTLEEKFERFIREKCLIPEDSFNNISAVYQDFFNRVWHNTKNISNLTHHSRGDFSYCNWTIFTTNYDTCLEFYWREKARIRLNTGFGYDKVRRTHILDPSLFYERPEDGLNLVKLHGSVSWMIEPDGNITEEEAIPARSFVGRKYLGPMMIYPIQQKELYVEPYISMLLQLNRELKKKTNWFVIGYSFNDPVIREIFMKNSDKTKEIVLLHPHANDIANQKLEGIEFKGFHTLEKNFGLHHNYSEINKELVAYL